METRIQRTLRDETMAFSVAVEMINIRMRSRMAKPVVLHKDMP